MIGGTPAMTMTLPSLKPGRDRHLVVHQLGAGRNAGHAHARLVHLDAGLRDALDHDRERARSYVDADAERLGDESAVMSSWVGPMPPVVKT